MSDPAPWLALLDRRLRILTSSIAAEWSVYVRFLETGDEVAIDADRVQDTMSLIKVPLLVTLMHGADRGEIDLQQAVTLADEDKRLGTGVLVHFAAGAQFTLRDAIWLMIVVSDNTATDICLRAAGGPAAVNAAMAELGIGGIEMTGDALSWFRALAASVDPELGALPAAELARRGYPALAPFELADARAAFHREQARPFSLASARGLGSLLARIAEGTCAAAASCAEIRRFLSGQQMQTMSPKYIWPVASAHKTGNFFPHISSDIGIFEPSIGSSYVFCAMTQQFYGQREIIEDTIARMSELVAHAAERA